MTGDQNMPIHFGMPTLIECPSLEQTLSLCCELGLDFVELNMNLPEYQLDRMDGADVKRIFQRYCKYPTIHLDENLNVCDFNSAVADAYLDTVLKTTGYLCGHLSKPAAQRYDCFRCFAGGV